MASKAMVSHNGPPGKSTDGPPSASLYVKNLPDLSKADLRMSLYMLFSTYGPVLDVVSMRTKKMRGQAHVVFRDTQASTQAMRALQGFDFNGKEMKVAYAKGRSQVFTRLEGVYKAKETAESTATELQQSIFNAPAVTGTTVPAAPETAKAPAAIANGTTEGDDDNPKGVKRRRDDESDEEGAAMDEGSDDDVSMEASSDEE